MTEVLKHILLFAIGSVSPTEDDILKAVTEREGLIQSFSCRMKRKQWHDASEQTSLEWDGTLMAEVGGRNREEGVKIARSGTAEKILQVYSGHTTLLSGPTGREFGVIMAQPGAFYGLTPLELVGYVEQEPVSRFYATTPASRKSISQAGSLIEMTLEYYPPDSFATRMTLLLDPSLSMALIRDHRRASYDRTTWLEHATTEYSNFTLDAATGVWLPGHASRIWNQVLPNNTTKLALRAEIEISDWVTNPVFSDELFTVEFPPGCTVNNQITGRMYQVGSLNDFVIQEQAGEAVALATAHDRWRGALLVANAAAMAAVFGWVAWRRLRPTSS